MSNYFSYSLYLVIAVSVTLTLKYKREYDHAGIQLVNSAGVFKIWVPGMNIGKPVAYFDLG